MCFIVYYLLNIHVLYLKLWSDLSEDARRIQ